MIIADFGSGNTCHNDVAEVRRMIDALAAVDPGRKAVIKWQLFEPATVEYCESLDCLTFQKAYDYAESLGYRTTASVFDMESLDVLLDFDIPFVKIAAREWCYPLIEQVPRGIPVVVSADSRVNLLRYTMRENMHTMACVPKYPADTAEYERRFGAMLPAGISDHTPDLTLWRKYRPKVYERHFKLPDSTGLDSGPFASTPDMWREILA